MMRKDSSADEVNDSAVQDGGIHGSLFLEVRQLKILKSLSSRWCFRWIGCRCCCFLRMTFLRWIEDLVEKKCQNHQDLVDVVKSRTTSCPALWIKSKHSNMR